MLIALGGLPGTGKSTLAAALGERLDAPVLAPGRRRGRAVAERGRRRRRLVAHRLRPPRHHGRGVPRPGPDRGDRRGPRHGRGAEPVRRIDGRRRDIPGWYELVWDDVEDVRRRVEPWTGERLAVDAVRPLDENVELVISRLG